MKCLLKKSVWYSSSFTGYVLLAIVVSLVVNFSYLLTIVVNQSDNYHQFISQKNDDGRVMYDKSGVLSIGEDGFGYIISEPDEAGRVDSVFVDRRSVRWHELSDGDHLEVKASVQKRFKAQHLIMRRVIKRNGSEFNYGALFNTPKQWTAMLFQLLYYFGISLLLLLVMNMRQREPSWRSFFIRGLCCALITIISYFFSPVTSFHTDDIKLLYQGRNIVDLVVMLKCLFMLVTVLLYSRVYSLVYQRKVISLENELLKRENLSTKYDMLVSQISPHFFFNSLSSLSMLVREKDEERALKYIDQLSYTFRYIVQNGNNSTCVKLRNEMQFAEAYSYLFKIRYADKIFFDVNVGEEYLDYLLPPMSLQPLIGNAVKHNTITSKRPFHIRIYTENNHLVVANKRYPLLKPQEGTGMGLENLNSRYQLMMHRGIEVQESEQEFVVRLPLDKPNDL